MDWQCHVYLDREFYANQRQGKHSAYVKVNVVLVADDVKELSEPSDSDIDRLVSEISSQLRKRLKDVASDA
jgi:hypothetical protein